MYRFYQAQDDLEAQLLVDWLHSSRIQATVLGRYQAGAAGELAACSFPWVWLLEDDDLARAQQLLKEFHDHQAGTADQTEWLCPACGTQVEGAFRLCWQCGTPRL